MQVTHRTPPLGPPNQAYLACDVRVTASKRGLREGRGGNSRWDTICGHARSDTVCGHARSPRPYFPPSHNVFFLPTTLLSDSFTSRLH